MSDLDSFFAKKDKKKGKTGKKFATTEEVAKKLEDITLKKDKNKKDKPLSNNPEDNSNGIENEDEWKEYQEDKKDYSGLKLQPLKVADINTLDNENQNELNEDGTEANENGKKAGPWKISDSQNEPKPVEETPKPQPAKTGAYVPPGAKTQALEPLSGGRIRQQLDVTSTTAFPTLDVATKPSGPKVVENAWTKKRVEPEVSSRSNIENYQTKAAAAPVSTPAPEYTPAPGSYIPPHLKNKK